MDTKTINRRLFSGFLTLTLRKIALLGIVYLNTNLFLTNFLPPEIIGVFNIANSVLAVFSFFSDIGLAASIIQKKELTENDLKTTFTIQQILASIIFAITFIAAPWMAQYTHIPDEGVWLIRALGFGFFLTSLKVLPSVLLERDLKFGPLVIVEIVETLAYVLVLDICILFGLGVNGYTYSVLVRGLTGVGLIYILAPWKVKWGISKESAKELIKFGIPFQLNSILAFLKDRLVVLIVANMVGPLGIGYATWAQNITFLPLEVMNIMTRLTFPAFSRLQHDPEALKETLERTIFFISLLSYPILFGVIAVVPSIVEHIYKYDYRPALPMIYLYSLTAFWAAMSTPFTNFLNAIGKIKITLKLMIMWTILEWALTPVLTYKYGFIGVALASAIISFTSLIPIFIIKKMTQVSIVKNTYRPFLAAMVMGIATYVFCVFYVRDLLTLAVSVLLGGSIYVVLIGVFARHLVIVNFKKIKNV